MSRALVKAAPRRGWFVETPAPGTVAVVSGDDGAGARQDSVALRMTDTAQVEARGDDSSGQLAS